MVYTYNAIPSGFYCINRKVKNNTSWYIVYELLLHHKNMWWNV